MLTLITGVRHGELLALIWGDVDRAAGRAHRSHGRGKPQRQDDREGHHDAIDTAISLDEADLDTGTPLASRNLSSFHLWSVVDLRRHTAVCHFHARSCASWILSKLCIGTLCGEQDRRVTELSKPVAPQRVEP